MNKVDTELSNRGTAKTEKGRIVSRTSGLTGETHSMVMDITREQVRAYKAGDLIKDAFPNLTADEREFFKTGITPSEWDKFFGENV